MTIGSGANLTTLTATFAALGTITHTGNLRNCTYNLTGCPVLASLTLNNNDSQISYAFANTATLTSFFASGCDALTSINVSGCALVSLDVSGNGVLATLNFSNNTGLASITISPAPFTSVDGSGCALDETNVDAVCSACDNGGQSNGTLNLSGGTNAPPGATGQAAISSLQGKGWSTSTN